MRIIESVFCIALFLFVLGVFMGTVRNMQIKEKNVCSLIKETNTIIDTDFLLREKIDSIKTVYWKSFNEEIKIAIKTIMESELKKGIEIIAVSEIFNSRKNERGIKVEWKYKNKIYETKEYIKPEIIKDE